MTTATESIQNKTPLRSPELTDFMNRQIERLEESQRFGTARNYRRALNSLQRFLDGQSCPLSSFTQERIEDYNRFLLRRGVVRNTVSFYMRILRSVYNKAVDERLVRQQHPFRNVYTGVDLTRKRAVDEQLIGRLSRLDLRNSRSLALTRDLFIFSYCSRGMAFVDLAFLRKRDVCDGVIRYARRKTGNRLCIRLEPCMQTIIDRYRRTDDPSEYLFPILTSSDTDKAYRQYQTALNKYNRKLRKLSRLLGLERALTSYTARHSWATAARNHNIPLSIISAGMGHSSEQITRIYLSTMEDSVVDRANHDLLADLHRLLRKQERALRSEAPSSRARPGRRLRSAPPKRRE